MISEFRLKIILLLLILTITFFGTCGTLVAIPVFVIMVLVVSVFGMTFLGSFWAPTPDKVMGLVIKESKPKKGWRPKKQKPVLLE